MLLGTHIHYNNIFYVFGNSDFSLSGTFGGSVFWETSGSGFNFNEPYGLEIDPGFNVAGIESEDYSNIENMESIYCPSEEQIFTPGQPYTGLNWPGTEELDYRGALDSSCSDVYIHCSPLGDIDCSGKVNSLDFGYIVLYWNTENQAANLDNSGVVDKEDAQILLGNYNLTN